jgi:DNA repair exonuclease SbcCD nuclease subunit
MKLAVFSDLHLTNQNSKFRVNLNGVSDLLVAQLCFVDWMIKDAAHRGCEALLFLGDITDRATLDPITQTYFNRCINKLVSESKMDHVILLEGNHCTSDQLNRYSVLGATRELVEDAHIVTKPECIALKDKYGSSLFFHVIPYGPDYTKIEKEIAELNEVLDPEGCHILLFHFPCSNAQLDNGVPSPKGVHLTEDMVSNFTLCLGGDFHRSQWLSGNSKAYYVGAPFNLKFNEQTDEPRGYAIVDVDDSGFLVSRSEPNPYNYEMLSVPAEEADRYVGHFPDPSRVILQVKGRLELDLLEALQNEGFYRFSNVKTSGDTVPSELLETVVELDNQDDEELVAEQLEDVDESLVQKVLELFERIQNDGE